MTIEYTYSPQDLKNRCHNCKHFKHDTFTEDGKEVEDWFYGTCTCDFNKIKARNRAVLDRACSWKNADKAI